MNDAKDIKMSATSGLKKLVVEELNEAFFFVLCSILVSRFGFEILFLNYRHKASGHFNTN